MNGFIVKYKAIKLLAIFIKKLHHRCFLCSRNSSAKKIHALTKAAECVDKNFKKLTLNSYFKLRFNYCPLTKVSII